MGKIICLAAILVLASSLALAKPVENSTSKVTTESMLKNDDNIFDLILNSILLPNDTESAPASPPTTATTSASPGTTIVTATTAAIPETTTNAALETTTVTTVEVSTATEQEEASPASSTEPPRNETATNKCEFNDWTEWTICTAPCNGGISVRSRSLRAELTPGNNVTEQTLCPDANNEQRKCNEEKCPIPCLVSDWTPWTSCNCTTGISVRRKFVLQPAQHGGKHCPSTLEARDCSHQCSRDCTVGDWKHWSPCTAECGNGLRRRQRDVLLEVSGSGKSCPPLTHIQTCSLRPCPSKKSVCDDRQDGIYGDPVALCSNRYLVCQSQRQLWRNCPSSAVYDPSTRRCNYRNKVKECFHHESSGTHTLWAVIGIVVVIGAVLGIVACFVRLLLLGRYYNSSPAPPAYTSPVHPTPGFTHLDVVATPPSSALSK